MTADEGVRRVLNEYFEEYIVVLAFAVAGFLLVAVAVFASSLIRPRKPTPAKLETYESGMDPVGSGWNQTHIRYYIFALLFLIFDVEALFLFPWAIRIDAFASPAFVLVEMLIFIGILIVGLAYAIRKGVLRWE